MKILSISNQNSNNCPISFGGFKSVVVAGDSRDIGRFMAVALKLTKEDLTGLQDVLKEFPNPKLNADVLSISAESHLGDAMEDVYQVFVNGHDFFNTIEKDNSDGELVLDFGKLSRMSEFKEKLKQLLERLLGERKLDLAKTQAEKKQMLQALSGKRPLSQDEVITNKSLRKDILERLHTVISEDGRVFNTEAFND